MNIRIAAMDFITRTLGVDIKQVTIANMRLYINSGKLDWGLVVGIANLHLVTPALWVSLRDKGLIEFLPKDLKEYLEALYSLNAERNRHLKNQIMEAALELNGQGIEPVLLKGAAHLFTDTFGDLGARIMGDVDMLVPRDGFETCLAALHRLRYRADDDLKVKFAAHHHYAPLFRPGDYAAIELHRDLLAQAASHILPTETAWTHTRLLKVEGIRLRVLSPTDRILHNILHSEVIDRNHQKGVICLRQLHDLVSTCARYGPEVDWMTVREYMDPHGKAGVLGGYLYLAHRLFGMNLPPQIRPTFAGVAHYLRCHLKIQWPWFAQWDILLRRFSTREICLKYGCESTLLPLTIGRMRYAIYLLKKKTDRAVEKLEPR